MSAPPREKYLRLSDCKKIRKRIGKSPRKGPDREFTRMLRWRRRLSL